MFLYGSLELFQFISIFEQEILNFLFLFCKCVKCWPGLVFFNKMPISQQRKIVAPQPLSYNEILTKLKFNTEPLLLIKITNKSSLNFNHFPFNAKRHPNIIPGIFFITAPRNPIMRQTLNLFARIHSKTNTKSTRRIVKH